MAPIRRITLAELVLTAGLTGVIVVGWVALVLAQLGRLNRLSLSLTLALIAGVILALRHFGPPSEIRNPKSEIRNPTWHDAAVASILAIAAFLYTPPADYAPAFLDAGWYTSTGALIARTGQLTVRPAALEDLSPTDRNLFVRTYRDLKASLPQFPDRGDLGFYNLVFAADLEHDGVVAPYHPPFLSVWIAILRLIGGPGLDAYAAPLFGLLFVLAIYAAGRAIFGPNVGLMGALLVALSPPVVYYARTSFAELLAGALIWGGVYAMSRYAALRVVGRDGISPYSKAPHLVLAGSAFGTALLVKIESFLLLPAITLFWAIWLRWRWATRREFVAFLVPFSALSGHAVLLNLTVLRPYAMLNGYGIWNMLVTALSQPVIWIMLVVICTGGIGVLVAIQYLRRLEIKGRGAAGLLILAGAGAVLLLTQPLMSKGLGSESSIGSTLGTLGLFLTPLGLCLGLVGLSTLVADDLNRRTAFLAMLIGTAGPVTTLMPAISSNVSHLYTIRRQLPVVVPALLLLVAYVVLRWAGPAESRHFPQRLAGLRRILVSLMLVLCLINFLDTNRSLTQYRELAGSSTFIQNLAQSFASDDIVLFESVDRGAHVGRFAAPLWAGHGVSAVLLSSTYPPPDRLAEAIQRWQAQGRRVYFVSQSQPPPFTLPSLSWQLVDRRYWAGTTFAAKMSFPPETWTVEIPFYIYEVERES